MTSPPPDAAANTRAMRTPPSLLDNGGPSLGDARAAAIAGDMLYGAEEIAMFLFGDRKYRRRVYNLVDGNTLPVFRIGVNICARRSVLLEWIATQEGDKGRKE